MVGLVAAKADPVDGLSTIHCKGLTVADASPSAGIFEIEPRVDRDSSTDERLGQVEGTHQDPGATAQIDEGDDRERHRRR